MLARASANIGLMRPTILGPLRKYRIVHLSAGMHHAVFVTHHGQMLTMGGGRAGQLGLGPDVQHSSKPVILHGGDLRAQDFVVSAVAGASHTVARTRKEWGTSESRARKAINRVYAFGGNVRGQLGLGEPTRYRRRLRPKLVARDSGGAQRQTVRAERRAPLKTRSRRHHTLAPPRVALCSSGAGISWPARRRRERGGEASARNECSAKE